ncbi:restriction endonuclease subunit S [Aeromonas caviae]|uniref:restriction endonuclease subunit S n=1 Tax=Aeromonas caviae TaxID=648 RepID=UPI002B465939|nr:restriction endonuclease subunit S [Aeromonas caviae]
MVPNGWKSYPLSEVCRKQISYGIVQTGDDLPNGIPCLRVVDLTKAVMCTSHMIKTSEEIHYAYKKTILEEGEIVMALRGEVGLVKSIDSSLSGANITRGLARISAKTSVVYPEFLLWELRSPKFRSDLMRRVGGSALQEISLTELRQVRTLIPPLVEQEKIAKILSTWDKAIITTEQLLANSQQQKKALIQQLLTGKKRLLDSDGVRFSGAWIFKKINQIATRVQRKSDGNEHPILTISSLSGFVRQDERYNRYMAGESVKNYILLEKSEFAYNKGNSKTYEFGCIFDLDGYETGLVPHVYVCFRLKAGLSHRYFKYLFEADYLKPQLGALVNTGVRNNGLLNIKTDAFMSTQVPVPCIEEQERIADVLHVSSEQISQLQKKLDCLKTEKQALMQQLLTGKRRVKVGEAA